jgi:UPF0716 protein FxsA
MVRRLLLIYAVVELAAVIAMVSTIGWGWTLLALMGSFVFGVLVWAPMAGWQLSAQLRRLRSGLKEPRSALSDGAMVTLATVLVLIPGLVSTTLGILLLMPPVRAVARPGLAANAMRLFKGRVPLITDTMPGRDGLDYIDGEVIDVHDVRYVRDARDVRDVRDFESPVLPYGTHG